MIPICKMPTGTSRDICKAQVEAAQKKISSALKAHELLHGYQNEGLQKTLRDIARNLRSTLEALEDFEAFDVEMTFFERVNRKRVGSSEA